MTARLQAQDGQDSLHEHQIIGFLVFDLGALLEAELCRQRRGGEAAAGLERSPPPQVLM